MRRVFILFMIVLLPLRGWAGDSMGVQMAASGMSSYAVTMPADCPMRTQANPPALDTGTSPSPAGMEGCTSCDLCIPMAELANTGLEAVSFAAHVKPLMAGVEFISACPAPALKPPIS